MELALWWYCWWRLKESSMIIDQPIKKQTRKVGSPRFVFQLWKNVFPAERGREGERVMLWKSLEMLTVWAAVRYCGPQAPPVRLWAPPHHYHLSSPRTPRHSGLHHTRLCWLFKRLCQPPSTSLAHYDTLLGYINITATTTTRGRRRRSNR